MLHVCTHAQLCTHTVHTRGFSPKLLVFWPLKKVINHNQSVLVELDNLSASSLFLFSQFHDLFLLLLLLPLLSFQFSLVSEAKDPAGRFCVWLL